jgi:hypothetical protein
MPRSVSIDENRGAWTTSAKSAVALASESGGIVKFIVP